MATMYDFTNFDEVFDFDPDYSYHEDMVHDILVCRKSMDGLFIEKVMKELGIKRPAKYYPPKTNGDLRNLHNAIIETKAADHTKISVLYYILLELDFATGRRDYSTALEEKAFLPQSYQVAMKGLWHMDRMEFENALEYLTFPSIVPIFADDVLRVLVEHNKRDHTLALAYYHTVKPTLKERTSIQCLFSALARTSVSEAFYFCRGQPENSQRHMFEMLVAAVLNNSSSDTIADRSVELVNLPFTEEEESWLGDYLLRGEGRSLKKGRDVVMMRKVGTGSFTDALAIKNIQKKDIGGLDWSKLSEAVEDGLGPRFDMA